MGRRGGGGGRRGAICFLWELLAYIKDLSLSLWSVTSSQTTQHEDFARIIIPTIFGNKQISQTFNNRHAKILILVFSFTSALIFLHTYLINIIKIDDEPVMLKWIEKKYNWGFQEETQ